MCVSVNACRGRVCTCVRVRTYIRWISLGAWCLPSRSRVVPVYGGGSRVHQPGLWRWCCLRPSQPQLQFDKSLAESGGGIRSCWTTTGSDDLAPRPLGLWNISILSRATRYTQLWTMAKVLQIAFTVSPWRNCPKQQIKANTRAIKRARWWPRLSCPSPSFFNAHLRVIFW